MKLTKRMRKKQSGMNAVTQQWAKQGFRPPLFTGPNGSLDENGALIPPFTKIRHGTPYVNANNF